MDKGRNVQYYGVIECVWDSYALGGFRIVYCSPNAFALMGFDFGSRIEETKEVYQSVNEVIKPQMASCIPTRDIFDNEPLNFEGYLKELSGSLLVVTYQMTPAIFDKAEGFTLSISEVSDTVIFARDPYILEILESFKAAYDYIVEIDVAQRCIQSIKNTFPLGEIQYGSPRIDTDKNWSWCKNNMSTHDYNLLRGEIDKLMTPPRNDGRIELNSKHFTVNIIVRGDKAQLDMLLIRAYGSLFILGKRLQALGEAGTNVIRIRTFGHFQVFVDKVPVEFKHPKAAELLAILVDRRGAFIDNRHIASYLWPNEEVDQVVLSRTRKIVMRLKQTLDEAGINFILESRGSNRRIRISSIDCDLMDYMRLEASAPIQYKGVYMEQFKGPWKDATMVELDHIEYRIHRSGVQVG